MPWRNEAIPDPNYTESSYSKKSRKNFNLPPVFKNSHFGLKYFMPVLFSFLSLLFWASPSLCIESHIRLIKNGVIYYYFSHKSSGETNNLSRIAEKNLYYRSYPFKKPVKNIHPIIQKASNRYGLPPSLIKAVIRVESNFNPGATSPKGAQGLMQLMPATAAHLQVADPYDIQENILAGTRYLFMLLQKFDHKLPHALAAYNAGPHRVEHHQTVPPIAETQDFVRNVCARFLEYEAEKSTRPRFSSSELKTWSGSSTQETSKPNSSTRPAR